jgi:hypothetical protein
MKLVCDTARLDGLPEDSSEEEATQGSSDQGLVGTRDWSEAEHHKKWACDGLAIEEKVASLSLSLSLLSG